MPRRMARRPRRPPRSATTCSRRCGARPAPTRAARSRRLLAAGRDVLARKAPVGMVGLAAALEAEGLARLDAAHLLAVHALAPALEVGIALQARDVAAGR